MGEVFEAIRTGPGGFRRRVALKRLLGDAAVRGASIKRFLAEARILAQLDHPNVIEVHDVVVTAGGYVIVMDLLRGATLGALARAARPIGTDEVAAAGRPAARDARSSMPVGDVLAIADQALAGLAHVHAARGEDGQALDLIHRDVTPNNVFVTDGGVVKLLDFGIAKLRDAVEAPLTRDGEIHGTLELLAPEVAQGDTADRRADLYQLGGCVYWALTGRYPHGSGTPAEVLARAAARTPERVAALRPDLPPGVASWIERAMAPRDLRFATSDEMRAALAPHLAPRDQRDAALVVRVRERLEITEATTEQPSPLPLPPPAPTSPAPDAATVASPVRRRSGSRRFATAGAVVIAIGGAVVGIVVATRDDGAVVDRRSPLTSDDAIVAITADAAPADAPTATAADDVVIAGSPDRPLRGGAPTADGVVFADGRQIERRAGATIATIPLATGTIPFDVDVIGDDTYAVWAYDDDRYRLYAVATDKTTFVRSIDGAGVAAITATGALAYASQSFDAKVEAPGVDPKRNVAIDVQRGATVTALAWSPDATRVAAVVWSADDSAIEIVGVPGLARASLLRRRFPPGEPRVFGWLDDRRLAYAVTERDTAMLYVLDTAAREEKQLATIAGTIVVGGHVGHGAIAYVRGRPARSLLIGELGSPLARVDVAARSLAGFLDDGRVVATTDDGVVAIDDVGTATKLAGSSRGDIAHTMLDDNAVITRAAGVATTDIVRIGHAGNLRIAGAPASDLDIDRVRCAGDRRAPCIVGHVDSTTLYAARLDPQTGTIATTRWNAGSYAVRDADHAIADDGRIATVDGRDVVNLRGADGDRLDPIRIGEGAVIDRVAWAGSDLIVTARRWRGHWWVALRITPAGTVDIVDASATRWLGIPRVSADGRIAIAVTDLETELAVFRVP